MFKLITNFLSLMFLCAIIGAFSSLYILWQYGRDLPDYLQLADYEPKIISRLYAGDGQLLAEYASERRLFVPIEVIPETTRNAFMSAEDKNFMTHPGVDFVGIIRAVFTNIKNVATGKRLVGASTITQQVAKNFLLTNERSIKRKIKEAILAFRIERAFSKEHILELYLNEIYLGFRSYGVAAAALNYFDKSLDELTLAESAFLAALPKAPNNYNPLKNYDAAVGRRNWVLSRMLEDKKITKEQAYKAKREPIKVTDRLKRVFIPDSMYFAEEVRKTIEEKYGENVLYEGGLAIRTTIDPKLQKIASNSLRKGLEAYDKRHGYRGEIARITVGDEWINELTNVEKPKGANENWELAVVLEIEEDKAKIGLLEEKTGYIKLKDLKWARETLEDQKLGSKIKKVSDVFAIGDVILVEKKNKKDDEFFLRQVPNVEGALVALDPHTGRVLAMAGGYSYRRSQYNRATQAKRQPGSAFKPFVYLAALDKGYTPADLILDAPFVLDQGPDKPKWKPDNYIKHFYGPTTLRVGVEKSRNVMTVRLAQAVGMDMISDYAKKFNIVDEMPKVLSMAIGAGETTAIRMTSAYGMLVNGGKRIKPTLIDRIQNRNGKTIYKSDNRICKDCSGEFWTGQEPPELPDEREQVTNPQSAYQITSILEGVVQRGTARKIKLRNVSLAGKTGTTNDYVDAWFVGFSPDLVAGIYVGFDIPKTLGRPESGGRAAAPIFKNFMQQALKDKPNIPFRMPEGIKLVRIDHMTGRPAKQTDRDVIVEAFKSDTEIGKNKAVIGGAVNDNAVVVQEDNNTNLNIGGQY